ncbi:hypothetical protein FACS1894205_2510 [Alphaproteobacteria bacterium]|nr:hypothetical protein FACS1894205_2510 [Alphaproteobacteria bacterium]
MHYLRNNVLVLYVVDRFVKEHNAKEVEHLINVIERARLTFPLFSIHSEGEWIEKRGKVKIWR